MLGLALRQVLEIISELRPKGQIIGRRGREMRDVTRERLYWETMFMTVAAMRSPLNKRERERERERLYYIRNNA